ncbi:hypothetical protein N8T08_002560 [Aspergillus melleus]|uniref:Uncharacterized protein n=1 Tax=Aspergillus melleus TaxID=138277 RepID=A0ACC3B8X1_9EURO|nr:hypothetical protein N8T08_002560 [Aspergillus melleus]
MNGTAPSAAAASLVLYDSHNLALLAQVLTAMATEALMGTVDNYHEFISKCRPHPGQAEVARNIRSFLSGSRLSPELDVNKQGLIQDRGLPPNLCADDPSLSFAMKGLDMHMTAYFSELGYLANSVASHVQTAEMNNQSVNSLALISARYTGKAVHLLSMMCAVHLYILCQALDLRALTVDFLETAKKEAKGAFDEAFTNPKDLKKMDFEKTWMSIENAWLETSQLDLVPRCEEVTSRSVSHILNAELSVEGTPDPFVWNSAKVWKIKLSPLLYMTYDNTRKKFFKKPKTPEYLAESSKTMYLFVREELGVPFHRGVTDHPILPNTDECPDGKKTIGSYVTRVYEAIRDDEVIEALKNVVALE